ncbi:MAG: DUF4097 domain-containing protein [Ruminococcaceae bacterium]|nr:DUF4097 domain-containing protein [Oscillospiraceae bacterium]
MKKFWIIFATVLIVVGIAVTGYALAACGFDFSRLSTVRYETATVSVTEDFHSISINANTSDIRILPSEDGTCRVTVCHQEGISHPVSVINGVLTVATEDQRTWIQRITIDFSMEDPFINVYLPLAQYDALTVRISTGDVSIPRNFTFRQTELVTTTGDILCNASSTDALRLAATTGDVTVSDVTTSTLTVTTDTGHIKLDSVICNTAALQVSTGKTHITALTCASLTSKGTTGDLFMKNVIASQELTVERNTGDVQFTQCDAPQISVLVSTGDVSGSLLTDKIFTVNSSTGDIRVPTSIPGSGTCRITTTTGDVYVRIGTD